jgi:beta-lactamase class A
MKYRILLIISVFMLQYWPLLAQTASLKSKIEAITQGKNAKVGVAVLDLQAKESVIVNNLAHYPMQSVFKFHLGLAVMNQVDKGKLSLSQKIFVKKDDLRPDTYSPMKEKYPNGNVDISLEEILRFTVSESDNNGCDILFGLLGGPKKVNEYVHSLGIKEISIVATEGEMHQDWKVQYTNWTTPLAAIKLLEKFHQQNILSKNSHDVLWKMMVETTTGAKKIRGLLPNGTISGHKSGWSGSNDAGLTRATNDIGIVTLPNGRQFAIAIFVMDSMEKEATNDQMIAEITKTAYDYFLAKK